MFLSNTAPGFLRNANALLLFALSCCYLTAATPDERLFLHPLFCDHAVLQRDVPVPVWGWTTPGTMVTVSFAGQSKTAVADSEGKWLVKLKAVPASAKPRTLAVTNAVTHQSAAIADVLVGDVWLCSGQSNMEMGLLMCNVTNDIATANFPQLRLLTVPRLVATKPRETLQCRWLPCSPDTVRQGQWGGFTAAGFFFGRELHRELGIPIGLIHSSWGGTVAEAWTSSEGLEPLGDFKESLLQVRANESGRPNDFEQRFESWCQRNDLGTREGWPKSVVADAPWKPVEMPRPFEQAGLPGFDGIVWFRREFNLPNEWAGKELTLELGPIDDIDTTWINGVKVGQVNRYDLPRSYRVPSSAVKAGRNEIVIRVLDTGGNGGLTGQPEQMRIAPAGGNQGTPLPLSGRWLMRAAAPLSAMSAPPQATDASNPNVTTVLYSGMIAPLLPYAIKGAIWYQGESNADRAWQYRRLLPAMITDWRKRFGVGAFMFYIVQLANWQATNPEPRDHNWAELREAQAWTAKTLRNCGLAVAIDIGDASDIHPKDKLAVGHRLALNALASTYGRKVEWSGPWYRSMKVEGDRMRLKFDHIGSGLVTKGNKLSGFAVAGEDRKFVWADAVIERETVIVSSARVPKPVAVRYAWDINPICNLYNQDGLPAVPFRTDDWPLKTQSTH